MWKGKGTRTTEIILNKRNEGGELAPLDFKTH